MSKSNIVLHSGKSQKTLDEERKNYYTVGEGKKLLQKSDKHQKGVQGLANDAMRTAMKENRGLRDNEIDNVIDNIEFGYSYRPAVRLSSKTSSAGKRYVARRNSKTGLKEWVLLR